MADLPDIDTSTVSFIAYWNAIEQGGSDVTDTTWEASDVTSYGNIDSITTYDNGVTGTLTMDNGQEAFFRVKDDGWIIVYNDRGKEVGTDLASPPLGIWGVANRLFTTGNPSRISRSQFDLEIQGLFNETDASNETNASINLDDVGLFSYKWSSATNVTLNSLYEHHTTTDSTAESYSHVVTGDFSYTGSTTVLSQWLTFYVTDDKDTEHSRLGVENADISWFVDTATQEPGYSARKASNVSFAQAADTSHTLRMELMHSYQDNVWAEINHLAIWS